MHSFGVFHGLCRTALLPELEACRTGKTLRHPLLNFDWVDTRLYSRLNQLFLRRRSKSTITPERNDWERLRPDLSATERYFWFTESLLQEQFSAPFLEPKKYDRIIGQIWTDPEIVSLNSDSIAILFNRPLPSSPAESFMTDSELQHLSGLSDELQVFRGHVPVLEHRLSWTLNPVVALDWACRHEPSNSKLELKIEPVEYQFVAPIVTIGTVRKSEIIAYVNRRGEDEILVRPEFVVDRESFEVIRSPK